MADRERQILDYLAIHDLPCAGCSYDLRGLKQTRCPECGTAVTLPDERPNPESGWAEAYLLGLISLPLVIAAAVGWLYGTRVIAIVIAAPLVVLSFAVGPAALAGTPLLWGLYGMAIGRRRRSARWRRMPVACMIAHGICFVVAAVGGIIRPLDSPV